MNIRYFAWLKQRTGTAQETVSPPAEVKNVGQLMDWIGTRHPQFAEASQAEGAVRCAVNQIHVERNAPVSNTDEVAFFPPVTGG